MGKLLFECSCVWEEILVWVGCEGLGMICVLMGPELGPIYLESTNKMVMFHI